MVLETLVLAASYRDSVVLMRIAAALRQGAGVGEAAVLMGTPANQELLAAAGLDTAAARAAGVDDLVLVVAAGSAVEAKAALAEGRALLAARPRSGGEAGVLPPRTLDSALRVQPDANLAAISVPGAFARHEAMAALRRGLHVFLFSDHVSIADELALKQAALQRGLLCMGPDCGTAYLAGVGLGFANIVPRGRIGCIAASGTGLQAVACGLAARGEGISEGIGVGGRDLGAEVAGAMTLLALGALARDPATEVIVLISKPPDPAVLPRLEAALEGVAKPVVACLLGTSARSGEGVHWVATLDAAAEVASALAQGRPWSRRSFAEPRAVRRRLAALAAPPLAGAALLGLYTGGTLAHEARLILEPLLGPVAADGAAGMAGHRIVDLGDDAYTAGRPHPMLDPEARAAALRRVAGRADLGVILLDLVLGQGAHPDPAAPLVSGLAELQAASLARGRRIVAVASIVGTSADPQELGHQVAQLEGAGVQLLASNAEAARFAALLLRPDLAETLLEQAP